MQEEEDKEPSTDEVLENSKKFPMGCLRFLLTQSLTEISTFDPGGGVGGGGEAAGA
jgi:hypothetical protein